MLSVFTDSNLSFPEIIINVCVFLVSLVFSLSIHEFMHGYAAYKCGDSTAKRMGRLSFKPGAHIDPVGMLMMLLVGFGWAKPVPINPSEMTRFKNKNTAVRIVSLAGVGSNFVVAFLAYFLFWLVWLIAFSSGSYIDAFSSGYGIPFRIPLSQSFSQVLLTIFLVLLLEIFQRNLMFMAFNLIPIPPLDGYHFLETFLPRSIRPKFNNLARYSSIIFILLVVMGRGGVNILGVLVNWIATPFLYIIQLPVDALIRLFGLT